MTLEEQLETLAQLGLVLNEGVTVEDLLYSFDRSEYEKEPFELILFMLGVEVEREPWGRSVCSRVWNFDTECINTTGDYVRIVKRISEVANQQNTITDLEDFVDIERGEAWLKYKLNGRQRYWTIEVDNDWVDSLTITYVMDELERDGFHFYFKDNGQASILFYLDQLTANRINELSNNALQRFLQQ